MQWYPCIVSMHTRFVEMVSRQAFFTTFPHAAKKILRNRQQIWKRSHGCIPGLQEYSDLNSYFGFIVGIRCSCHKACEVAKEYEMYDNFFILSDKV